MMRTLFTLVVAIGLPACGGSAPTDLGATETTTRRVVAQFSGYVDAQRGTLVLEPMPATSGNVGVSAAALSEVSVVQDGVAGSGPDDTVELVTESTAIKSGADGCGAFNAFTGLVTLRSFFAAARLENTYVELTRVVPAGHEACNSAPVPPGGEVSDIYGLFAYGTIEAKGVAGDHQSREWKLRLPTSTNFSFVGRVMADVIATRSVTTAFGAGADTYAQGSVPSTNFGASPLVTTRSTPGNASNTYKDYLRFDLSALRSQVDLANARSASLSFVVTGRSGVVTFGFYGLLDGLPADAAAGWSELSLTYSNAPANVGKGTADLTFFTAAPGDAQGNYVTSLGQLSVTNSAAGATLTFSSPALLDLVRNDTNGLVTLALRRVDAAGIIHLYSKENTGGFAPPTLTVVGRQL